MVAAPQMNSVSAANASLTLQETATKLLKLDIIRRAHLFGQQQRFPNEPLWLHWLFPAVTLGVDELGGPTSDDSINYKPA